MSPLISVAMSVLYRQEDLSLLKRSVDSILSQSLTDFELLVCCDGSTEEVHAFLRGYEAKDFRVKVVCGENKETLQEKLNVCLAAARGEFIARMDDDDFSHPDRFEKQIAFLNAHPEIAFVGCNVAIICNGTLTGQRTFPQYPTVRDFYMVQPYIHPTLMFRREALKSVNGYSEKRSCVLCEDYDLLLRLYAHGRQGANLQEILFDYSVPATAKGNRTMKHRWNESVTRWQRFRELGVLHRAFPYVVKPLATGLLPEYILRLIKNSREGDILL